MIDIQVLTPVYEAEYKKFLLRDPRSLIYSTTEYRDFLREAVGGVPGYYLALDDSGCIMGVLPTFQLKVSGVGSVINSLPWYGSHGGAVTSPDAPKEVREALINKFSMLAASPEILSATLILSPYEESEKDTYESLFPPTAIDGRVGQITPLPLFGANTQAQLETVLAQKTRNLVRKSLKQGFTLERDSSDKAWDFLYQVHQENMEAIGGRAKPQAHFQALRNAMPSEWQQISIAMLGDEPVAALLLLYFNKTVEYFTPVIRQEYRSMQPLSFLIWNGMLDAISRGYKWWNWGGTWATQHSLHHFKAGWGAIDYPYTYLTKVSAEGLAELRKDRNKVAAAFPYYFVFPFDQLG